MKPIKLDTSPIETPERLCMVEAGGETAFFTRLKHGKDVLRQLGERIGKMEPGEWQLVMRGGKRVADEPVGSVTLEKDGTASCLIDPEIEQRLASLVAIPETAIKEK